MKPDSKRTEILVGLFVLAGLVLLGGLILRFSSIRERLHERDPYYIVFDDASGLTVNSPVRLAGTKIGIVSKKPELTEDGKVFVEISVYRDERHRIPQGARITLPKEGLLGDTYVNIARPAPPVTGYLEPGDTIKGADVGGLENLQEAANQISQQTQVLLQDIRSGLKDLNTAIGKLDKDVLAPENLENFKASLSSLNHAITRVDKEILSQENTDNLRQTLDGLRRTGESIEKASAKLDPLLAKGDETMSKLGKAADSFKNAGDSFNTAAKNAGATFGEATAGDGLMTALLKDEELRDDFKALVSNLRSRGILFYKDKAAKEEEEEAKKRVSPGKRAPQIFKPGLR